MVEVSRLKYFYIACKFLWGSLLLNILNAHNDNPYYSVFLGSVIVLVIYLLPLKLVVSLMPCFLILGLEYEHLFSNYLLLVFWSYVHGKCIGGQLKDKGEEGTLFLPVSISQHFSYGFICMFCTSSINSMTLSMNLSAPQLSNSRTLV